MKGQLAVIKFLPHEHGEIDNSLPDGEGGEIDNSLPPGFVYPGHGLPRPPHKWPPSFPPGPTDPDWGVGAPGPGNGQLPIYLPARPDNSLPGLPPVAGHWPLPDPPPGTIWPPLPPGAKPGKAALLFWLEGVGYRYVVVDLSNEVDNELPGGRPSRPDNTLPGTPEPKK